MTSKEGVAYKLKLDTGLLRYIEGIQYYNYVTPDKVEAKLPGSYRIVKKHMTQKCYSTDMYNKKENVCYRL